LQALDGGRHELAIRRDPAGFELGRKAQKLLRSKRHKARPEIGTSLQTVGSIQRRATDMGPRDDDAQQAPMWFLLSQTPALTLTLLDPRRRTLRKTSSMTAHDWERTTKRVNLGT
jgi:hypothetical protein